MSNKEEFLRLLKETSDVVFNKFITAFGIDDWCEATKDFVEARELIINKQNIVSELEWWNLNRDPEKQRQIIIDAFKVFIRENVHKEENDYNRTELGKDLAQKL